MHEILLFKNIEYSIPLVYRIFIRLHPIYFLEK